MVSLALDTEALAASYDRVGDRQFRHGQTLIEDLALAPGEHVLDVGCGTGLLSAYVAEKVGPAGNVVALDPLPLRVELLKKKSIPNLRAFVARAEDLSALAAASFDAAYLNSVYHWLPEKAGPLAELFRVLRPAGRLGITSASRERPHDAELVLREVFASPRISHVEKLPNSSPHKVTAEEFRAQLVAAGFENVVIELRSFTDHFADADDLLAWNVASSFGNFLSHFSEEERGAVRSELTRALDKFRRAEGIELQRHLLFARATKPNA